MEESVIQSGVKNHHLCRGLLPPIEELFMTLVRVRLGLVEQDVACRFSVSQSSTVTKGIGESKNAAKVQDKLSDNSSNYRPGK